MELNFKPVTAEDYEEYRKYFALRPNKACDSVFLDTFIWRDYYHVQCAVCDEKALLFLMKKDDAWFSAMPMCAQEDLPHYFQVIVDYFNQVLNAPFRIALADEEAVHFLDLDPEQFEIREEEDLKDYLYDAEAMRTLAGKKLHKKKNHINAFLREYEGRYEYRRLDCENRYDVWKFLYQWSENKTEEEQFEQQLDYEVNGIHEILRNCYTLNVRMAGVYIDGALKAFTIGTFNPLEKMAVIHIEKADPQIRGLYQFINQQFLINEFRDAVIVNREDDLGMEGLRKAKMSYYPIDFARKYRVTQKHFPPSETVTQF